MSRLSLVDLFPQVSAHTQYSVFGGLPFSRHSWSSLAQMSSLGHSHVHCSGGSTEDRPLALKSSLYNGVHTGIDKFEVTSPWKVEWWQVLGKMWNWKDQILHNLTPYGKPRLLLSPPRHTHKDAMLLSPWVALPAPNTPCTFKPPFLPPRARALSAAWDAHFHPTASLSAYWWLIYSLRLSPNACFLFFIAFS